MKPLSTPKLSLRRAVLLSALATGLVAALTLALFADGSSPMAADPVATVAVPAGPATAGAPVRRSAEEQPAASGWYTAPVGTQLRFAVDLEVQTELVRRTDGHRATSGETRLDGTLELTVLAREADEIITAVRFPGLSLTVSPKADETELRRVAQALDGTTLVRTDADGRATGYRFPAAFDFFAANLTRTVLGHMRFIVAADAPSAWTVTDRDDTGRFEAEYAWQSATVVTRRKLRYLELAAECEMELDSRATARFDRDVGWLVAAEIDERSVASFEAMSMDAHTGFCGTMRLTSAERVSLAGQPNADPAGAWLPVVGDRAEAIAVARESELGQWRVMLDGVELEGLLAELGGFAATEHGSAEFAEAWEQLSRLLELDPEAVGRLRELVLVGRFDQAMTSAVLTALGNAGTEAAQAALTSVREADVEAHAREAATVALVQVERPTAAVIDSLLATSRQHTAGDGLGATSLLVLGALAPRHPQPSSSGRSPVDELVAMEQASRDRGTIETWLHALGNSGTPRAVELARPYFAHESPDVRRAAAAALRKVHSDSAYDLLARVIDRDGVDGVRAQAAESLGDHGTRRATSKLRQVVLNDPSEMVRRAAIYALSQRLDDDGLAALAQVASADPSDDLKRLASQILRDA